jgi:hypothetical protein
MTTPITSHCAIADAVAEAGNRRTSIGATSTIAAANPNPKPKTTVSIETSMPR